MAGKLKTLRIGRLEYERYYDLLHWKHDYVTVRLVLFNLPIGSTVTIQTHYEKDGWKYPHWTKTYAFKVDASKTSDIREILLNLSGSITIAVVTAKQQKHEIVYWLDSRDKRLKRRSYHKLALTVENELRRNEDAELLPVSKPEAPVLIFPPGTLWTSMANLDHEERKGDIHGTGAQLDE